MLDEFLNLLSRVNIESLTNLLENGISDYLKYENSLDFNSTSFEEVDDHYELKLKVKEGTNENNIKIDLVGNTIKIVYKEKTTETKNVVKITETLPEDADNSTLDASIIDGELVVTVNKLAKYDINNKEKYVGVDLDGNLYKK